MGYVRITSGSCQGHLRVMSNLGIFSNCVNSLVVFEAETGFSVLSVVEADKILLAFERNND